MAHVANVGAAIWSQIMVATQGETTDGDFINIPNMRGTPQIGNEANIVQVPQYRSAAALNIAAQARLPDFEFELNFVPNEITHQALILSAGFLGGTNVRSSGDADHPSAIVIDNDGTLEASGAASATATVFTANQTYTFRLFFRLAQTGTNSYFEFDGQVAGFSAAPNPEDASIATVSLSLSAVPVGPLTI